jgi:peroxiredoxin
MPHSPWDYKQRDHLLLLFIKSAKQPESYDLLQKLQQTYASLREEYCAVLIVTADPVIKNTEVQTELNLPFPLLGDPIGRVIARYTIWDPQLLPSFVLANRYNALYQQWIANTESELPPLSEILACLNYMNSICTP